MEGHDQGETRKKKVSFLSIYYKILPLILLLVRNSSSIRNPSFRFDILLVSVDAHKEKHSSSAENQCSKRDEFNDLLQKFLSSLFFQEVATPVRPFKVGDRRQQQQQQNKPNSGQGNKLNIFNNNRPPPRIRPPVPNSEGKKQQPLKTTTPTTTTALPAEDEYEYVDYVDGELGAEVVTTTTTTTQRPTTKRRVRRPKMSTTSTTTTAVPFIEEEFFEEEFFEEEIVEPVTTPAPRLRRPNGSLRGTGTRPSRSSTTTTATPSTSATSLSIDDEPIQLPSKPNPSLFNRRTAVVNILKRRGSTTPLPAQEIFNEYDELIDEELVDQAPVVTQVKHFNVNVTAKTCLRILFV